MPKAPESDPLSDGIVELLHEAYRIVWDEWDADGDILTELIPIAFEKTLELLLQAHPIAEWVAEASRAQHA